MNEYQKRILNARKDFINLNFEQEKELFKIYSDAGDRLINKILNMTDSRTKIHNIEQYKIINEYRTELYNNLNKTIVNNINRSSDIQTGVQLSFVDMIAPDVKINQVLKRTITKVSSDSVKQLIAGDNGSKIDAIIKDNIAKGANVRELAKELDKYVNPKNRVTPKTFADGIGGDSISYQARRLARTSITHAQTETMIQNAKKNPFCKGLKWNLSASHSARMHGKSDVCDNYNGKTFKLEEVPLQHANCLCYFTEVLEDFDKCIETMKDWSNGKKNSKIDEWIKAGNDKTSIKVTTPDHIQTKMELNDKTSDIQSNKEHNINESNVIRSDSKTSRVASNAKINKKSNVNWNEELGISEENSDKLNEVHTELNKFMNENDAEKLAFLSISSNEIVHELTSNKGETVDLNKESFKVLNNAKDNDIIFVHNHPTSTTFSKADLQHIFRYSSVNALTLECADGTKFIFKRESLKSGILKYVQFCNTYPNVYNRVIKEKYLEVNDPEEIESVWDKFLDEVNKQMAERFGITYKEVKE
ncbi:hypothetical protein [Clostridium saccharoperbutylacetonicum]|uniref:hypothetical protein n=1 Tax=Clostridium saccharoperbutylacetonicum TaxID=36745 RepID=UPI0009840794|nr:hypothetical protein [Clostridium saccharoperbutylacetonicum]AQR95550.1 hypothetical protein CLSAP_28660 [Clostridium saccharoperbutylacetonicum]NSB31410.1 hypothetical protein [Clostridium saccharoperbutylacetonicum]